MFRCATWTVECVLTGHERTPWTVKFHPHNNRLLASGSLDQTVRIWDVSTKQCLCTAAGHHPSILIHLGVSSRQMPLHTSLAARVALVAIASPPAGWGNECAAWPLLPALSGGNQSRRGPLRAATRLPASPTARHGPPGAPHPRTVAPRPRTGGISTASSQHFPLSHHPGRHHFDFVVSCIAFHSSGELLAVAAGKRILLWR